MFQVTTIMFGDVLSGTFDSMESAMADYTAECSIVDERANALARTHGFTMRDISEKSCAERSGIMTHGFEMVKPDGSTTAIITYLVYVM